jgi:fused signal recognition particle receptor
MGFLDKFKLSRLKEGLARTREALAGGIQKVLSLRTKVDDELIASLEEALLGADVGVETTEDIISRVRKRAAAEKIQDPGELTGIVKQEILNLGGNGSVAHAGPFELSPAHKPHVIMVVGVNGAGKTTTIGKLAHTYKEEGKSVVIAAADTFRAAANEQLDVWAKRAGVDIVRQMPGADPAAVAYDALSSAKGKGADVLIIDTAGRLHTKVNLMEELKKISRVLRKLVDDAPHDIFLVLDASTGQNAVQQARQFTAAVGVTGIVLTKLDGTAKGGVVISINRTLGIPVRFIGVGEKIDDLQPFDRTAFIDALFEQAPA